METVSNAQATLMHNEIDDGLVEMKSTLATFIFPERRLPIFVISIDGVLSWSTLK